MYKAPFYLVDEKDFDERWRIGIGKGIGKDLFSDMLFGYILTLYGQFNVHPLMDWNSLLTITFYYAVFATYTAHNHVIISTNNIHFRFADLALSTNKIHTTLCTFRLRNIWEPRPTSHS